MINIRQTSKTENFEFNIDPEPVIMAGGLWSDINAWDEAGREISVGVEDGMIRDSIKYLPRDVWLIELTGGPGTECDNCPDYTYSDVVNKYWPVLVGGVLKLTGKSEAAYVGHSNGGRIALDAMKNYTIIKNQGVVGTLSDGSSITLPSSNPITNYIGVGVPGKFMEGSPFANCMKKYGTQIQIQLGIITHPTQQQIGNILSLQAVANDDNNCKSVGNNLGGDLKISKSLASAYLSFINSTLDVQPGQGVSLTKGAIIAGTLDGDNNYNSDFVVPIADEQAIANNVFGTLTNHYFEYFVAHSDVKLGNIVVKKGQQTYRSIKNKIKEVLNG